MISNNIFNLKAGGANNRLLWGNILFALMLFLLVLYAMQVPQSIQIGRKGQIALKELDGMSDPLLNIKTAVSQFQLDGNVSKAESELQRLGEKAESSIQHYKYAVDYSDFLSKNIVNITAAYNKWFDAEYEYLVQHPENYNFNDHDINEYGDHYEDHILITHLHSNDVMFLGVMAHLYDGEPALHADIEKGQDAYKVLQWASGLLMLYVFAIIFYFQRKSSREHLIREKNLEMTLHSIGEAVIATDISGRITCMNPEAERLTGWHFKDAKDQELSKVFRVVNAHSGMPVNDLIKRVQRERGIVVLAEDSMLIAANGNRYQIYENGAPIYDDSEKIIGVVLVFRDITQEHELRNSLNENALRLQRVVDTSMDGVIVVNEQGMISEWNPAAENIFGWSYAEARKQPIHELIIPKEFRESHLQGMRRLIMDDEVSFVSKRIESMALHRDGHTFPVELAMTSIKTENGWVFNAFIRDLTKRNSDENLIKKNNILLNEAERIAKVGSWELDLVDNRLYWSNELCNIYCVDPSDKEATYDTFSRCIHPDDKDRVEEAFKKSIKENDLIDIRHRIVTSDGIKFIHGKGETTYDENGRPLRTLGVALDITEQVIKENLIDKNNVISRKTQRIAKLGYWELDLENGVLEWSDEIFSIFDIDPATSEPSYGLFINKVHPEDRALVDNAYTESLQNKKPYNIAHRIVTGKGVRIVHETCETTFDDEGKPLRSLGLVQDITERVNDMDELRLAATTFDTHAGILITDKNGIIVRVNPAFEKMTGYSSKELVGKNPRILNSGKQSNEFYKALWDKLITTGMWQGELWNKRKDARLYAEWLTITAVKDDTGEVKNYVSTSQDITERKQAEKNFQQVNTVINLSPVVLFRWKAAEGWPVEFVSENVSQFGYTVEELVSGKTPFSSIVHPDDLERVAREVEEYSSNGIDLFTQEYRIVSPAGEEYWIDDRTMIDRDTDGTILCYQGIVLDITARVANNGEGTAGSRHVQEDGQADIVS